MTRKINGETIPAYRYEGGKGILRNWICQYLPKDLDESSSIWVEPFVGRGNMFWYVCHLSKFGAFWLNDLRTIPFFRALAEVDIGRVPAFIYRWDYPKLREDYESGDPLALCIEPALCWSGRGLEVSTIGSFVPGKLTETGEDIAHNFQQSRYIDYLRTSQRILQYFGDRVILTELDFKDLPWDTFDESYFVYLDPPYLSANVSTYSEQSYDATALIETLRNAKFRWLLSEYKHPLYLRAFGNPIAEKATAATIVKVRVGESKPKRVECLWSNY